MSYPARILTHDGITDTLDGWAVRRNLAPNTIRARLDKLGWSVGLALDTPPDRRFRRGGRPAADAPRPAPKLRRHKATGQAFVRWQMLGRDCSRYFGPWGSEEARAAYRRFAAEWAAGAYSASAAGAGAAGVAVAELLAGWLHWCAVEYQKCGRRTSEVYGCRAAAAHCNAAYGEVPAAEFGPEQLRAVRGRMVDAGLARQTVNVYVSRLVRAFRWGVGQGIVPAGVAGVLREVAPLKPGRTAAPERKPRGVITPERIAATVPHLAGNLRRRAVLSALIECQRLTGMRPCEACAMRPCDLDRTADVWVYTVAGEANKNHHRGIPQVYYLGPLAQAVLAPWLATAGPEEPVFCTPPAKAGGRRVPVRPAYYGLAVRLACRAAGVQPWSPHQLRHTYATEVARRFGSLAHAAAAIGDTEATAARHYVQTDPRAAAKIAVARAMG